MVFAASLLACGGDDSTPAETPDGNIPTPDASSSDAPVTPADSSTDAAKEAATEAGQPPPSDGGGDATTDGPAADGDAMPGAEGGGDALAESASDAPSDQASQGTDSGDGGGFPSCSAGQACVQNTSQGRGCRQTCTADAGGCPSGEVCIHTGGCCSGTACSSVSVQVCCAASGC